MVFVWKRVENATDNYHAAAGVLVVAASLEEAELAFPAVKGLTPDFVYDTRKQEKPNVVVFPDAGCC